MTDINLLANSVAVESQGLETIQYMKKYILKQIDEITQDEISMMEDHEIVTIYKQLISQASPETQSEKRDQAILQDKNEKDDNSNKNDDNLQITKTQLVNQESLPYQSNKNIPNKIEIKGQFYTIPTAFNSNSYITANKKFQLICSKPQPQLIEEKRKLICSILGPTMAAAVKSFKKQQINETYSNLKVINRRQVILKYNSQYGQQQYQTKQFIVFIKKIQITEEEKQKLQSRKRNIEKVTKQTKINSPLSKSSKHENENMNMQAPEQIQMAIDFEAQSDQFFNQMTEQRNQKFGKEINLKNNNDTVKENKQPTMKQVMRIAKQKRLIQNSTQTDKIYGQAGKTKSKLIVVSQTQYIEEIDDQSISSVRRARHWEQNIGKANEVTSGLNANDVLEQLLLNPGIQPNSQILKWINGMKNTLRKLEYQYMKQFQSNWVQIE